MTLETLQLRKTSSYNNGYFLANIGEKIADRLPKFVEIAGGYLAITLPVAFFLQSRAKIKDSVYDTSILAY